jgi:esterase/lipase
LKEWKETGVAYILNGRTKQQMPLNYQLYEDWCNNKERLDIDASVTKLKIPMLICHGTNDEAVNVSAAHHLKSLKDNAEIFLTDSDHVFGRQHPWTENHLPEAMQLVVERTIGFCN